MSTLRPSRVLSRLRAGEVARCIKLNLGDARVAEIAALAGFDCIWTDLEHVANDLSVIERQVWAAKAHDVDVLTRVPRGSYSDLVRALELDSSGIMVPHVMSLADAQGLVQHTRFHPIGRRALDGGNADGRYGMAPLAEYIGHANAERMLVLQVEDPEVVDDLDAIAAIPGVDMLFFGPGDFSHALGAPGQWDHPELRRARARVAEACRDHGKFAGTVASPSTMGELIDMGYSFLSLGADVIGLAQYFSSVLGSVPTGDGTYSVRTPR